MEEADRKTPLHVGTVVAVRAWLHVAHPDATAAGIATIKERSGIGDTVACVHVLNPNNAADADQGLRDGEWLLISRIRYHSGQQ